MSKSRGNDRTSGADATLGWAVGWVHFLDSHTSQRPLEGNSRKRRKGARERALEGCKKEESRKIIG